MERKILSAGRVQIRPRQYAQSIIAMKSLEARRAALKEVPEYLRAMVGCYLLMWWERK